MDDIFLDCDFLLLQEHWLYKSEFPKLLSLVSSTDMTAVSAMDESIHRVGRPFGGCAIVWRASITGQITKIDSDCNRLCAIMYTCNNIVSEPNPLQPLRDLQYGLGEMVFGGCRHLEYVNIWCFNEPK